MRNFLALKPKEFVGQAARTLWNNPGKGNDWNQSNQSWAGIFKPQKAPETLKHWIIPNKQKKMGNKSLKGRKNEAFGEAGKKGETHKKKNKTTNQQNPDLHIPQGIWNQNCNSRELTP